MKNSLKFLAFFCFLLTATTWGCSDESSLIIPSSRDRETGSENTADDSESLSEAETQTQDSSTQPQGSDSGSADSDSDPKDTADSGTGPKDSDTVEGTGSSSLSTDTVTDSESVEDTAWPCNPDAYPLCKDSDVVLTCTEEGVVEEMCQEGRSCCGGECLDDLCTPNEDFACLTDTSFHFCDACGTSFVESSCPKNHYCDEPNKTCSCEYPVNIMFVLDASGSMQLLSVEGATQWDISRAAIADVMESYPRLVYGLSTFPDRTVTCSSSHICEGMGGCDFTEDIIFDLGQSDMFGINDYLENRSLAAKPEDLLYVMTPLVGMFEHLGNQYPTSGPVKTHQYPSYLVLISDGEDSCYNPLRPEAAVGPLGRAVRRLVDEWNVKTYAIGFNLEGGQDQLNAIAMNGGTGRASFIPATNPADLKTALDDILAAINPRDCSGEDVISSPNCAGLGFADNDGDGWCSNLDCDDGDENIHPGSFEVASNGIDDNCDGLTDVADDDYDNDGDGYSVNQGDCNDADPLIGPDALEVIDGIDNNCDGLLDNLEPCACGATTGATVDAFACAAELSCDAQFAGSRSISSPTGDNLTSPHRAYSAVMRFGSTTNALAPRAGGSYALLGTGDVLDATHNDDLGGGNAGSDPYSKDGYSIYDAVEYSMTLTAPQNARGFSIDYVFFSTEYDEYVGSQFNDKFYIFMNGPQTTGGKKRIINFTDCRKPSEYYDFAAPDCPLASGYCCYLAINTALSECCWYGGCTPTGNTNISGTGFSCGKKTDEVEDVCLKRNWLFQCIEWGLEPLGEAYKWGSSTGWLKTTWTVQPGETFNLTFHIHDTSDHKFDSQVILDNFTWHTTAVTPGTEPI